jgi:hypothetical protein
VYAKGLWAVRDHFADAVKFLVTEDEQPTVRALIESLGTKGDTYLSGIAEVPLEIGQTLAKASLYAGRYTTELDKEGLLALARNLDAFGANAVTLRDFIAGRISKYSEWDLYFQFVRELPEAVRPTYDVAYRDLSHIPEHRASRRSRLVLSNLDLFPAQQHQDIVMEMLSEGSELDFRSIPRGIWSAIDQKAVAELLTKKFSGKAVQDNISSFTHLPASVAERWWNGGQQEFVLNNLASFESLPPSLAIRAVQRNAAGRVLANVSSFTWERGSFEKFVHAMGDRAIGLVLDNIDLIPSRLLAEVESRYFFAEYQSRLALASEPIYKRFCQLRKAHETDLLEAYVREVRDLASKMISCQPHDDEMRNGGLYDEMVEMVYPQHSVDPMAGLAPFGFHGIAQTRYTAKKISNVDRSGDLSCFQFEQRYVIDLSESVAMVLRERMSLNSESMDAMQKPVDEARDALVRGTAQEKKPDTILEELVLGPGQRDGNRRAEVERRIASRMIDVLLEKADRDAVRADLLRYHVLTSAHELEYLQGTRDRASRARNRDYAYLLIMREFFADRLRDTTAALAGRVIGALGFAVGLQQIHRELSEKRTEKQRKDIAARANLEKRGFTPGLADSLIKVLNSKDMESAQKRQVVARIIGSEQKKISLALSALTDKEVDPEDIHIGSFSADKVKSLDVEPIKGLESSDHLAFVRTCFADFLAADVQAIDREIAKYRPEQSVERGSKGRAMRLEAYFTKNHASVHARRVGGVCVALDWHEREVASATNPRLRFHPMYERRTEQETPTQWDLPNYFQLVLRNPITYRCEGLVLLHHYESDGKKILVASFNPCSTYLYKVNERELFKGLLGVLVEFAEQNDFDMIGCSTNRAIRTNRTGGAFELSMNDQIKSIGKTFTLPASVPFSYKPAYIQREFDILWERK